MSTFNIDFFELLFLAEACIPPVPIARGVFWGDLIDKHYHKMTSGERAKVHQFVCRHTNFKPENMDCALFKARYDPDNQYLVTCRFNKKTEEHVAFKMGDKYLTATNTHISPTCIKKVEKIKTETP